MGQQRTLDNLLGRTFGRYTVVGRAENRFFKSGNQTAYWICKCSCGNVHEVSANNLKRGKAKSCGCLRSEVTGDRNRLRPYESLYNYFLAQARHAKRETDITYEWFVSFINANTTCHYCRSVLLWVECRNIKKVGRSLPYNMDRVDNDKVYLKDNVVACCPRCNRWKLCSSYEDFYVEMEPIRRRNLEAACQS